MTIGVQTGGYGWEWVYSSLPGLSSTLAAGFATPTSTVSPSSALIQAQHGSWSIALCCLLHMQESRHCLVCCAACTSALHYLLSTAAPFLLLCLVCSMLPCCVLVHTGIIQSSTQVLSGLAALERHTATIPDEEVQDEAELRQEQETGTAAIKEPTTNGDFTTNSTDKPSRQPIPNGLSKSSPHVNGNGVINDEIVPLANDNDPHVDPNDPHFLIPPRFSTEGVNPSVQQGLPIAGITHPHVVPVPAHVHVESYSDGARPALTQNNSRRNSMEAINRTSRDTSRKSLDLNGSRRNLGQGSKKKLGTGMSLSQMMSQKKLSTSQEGDASGEKGMVLPFDPLHLTFHDLNYYVDLPKVPCLFSCLHCL